MSILRVDFTNVESFEVIPTDVYAAVITGIEEKLGKTSKLPYLNIELTISEGEYEGRKLWGMVSFSPKAAFKVKEFLLACGLAEEDLGGQMDIDPEEYIGTELNISVVVDQWEGKENNKVDMFLPLDEPAAPAPKATVKGKAPAAGAAKKPKFK